MYESTPELTWGPLCLLFRFLLASPFVLQSLLIYVWHKRCDRLMIALLQHSDFIKGA
jgi:hypothetical protein